VHLDIKPSNVLLAGDGQPMLLDFHLAREIVPRGGGPLDRLGGTPGYMSREQLLATEAVREGKTLSMALDGRSDLYSLGALLYESLGGALPSPEPTAPRRLRQLNPQVSRSLDDLVHKCLARDPAARYGEAADVAADLRRHLADLPLHGVANRSLAERWQKWRRRKPQAFALMTAGVLVLSALGTGGGVFYEQRLREARSALEQGQQDIASHDYGGAIEHLQAGLDSVGWLVGQYDMKQSLRSKLALAQSARLSDTLHELVERLRFVDSFASVSTTKLRQLDTGCARVWDARNQIAGNDSSKGNPEVERHLRTDLIDLALLWADLRVRLAPDDEVGTAHRDALRLLDEAQALCGSSAVLEMARREHELAAGVPQRAVGPASPLAPKTAWEYFALGRSLFRADQLSDAQQQFRHALDLEPDAFWPNFYLTLSAYRLEHFEEALNAASVCVALSPQSAECFYNRALSHQALGHADEALHDFARALSLDPTLAVAALQRGKLLAQQQHYADALVDLRTALAQGANPAEVWYETAQVHLARQDSTAALKSLEQSLLSDPEYPPALALRSKLDARP
jgi:eukaryotic-like serine/threonine-protein kinase